MTAERYMTILSIVDGKKFVDLYNYNETTGQYEIEKNLNPPEPENGELAGEVVCPSGSTIYTLEYNKMLHDYVETNEECPPLPPEPEYDFKMVGLEIFDKTGTVAYKGGSVTTTLAWLVSQVGKKCYIPEATYNITTSIVIKDSVDLYGDGPDKTVLNFTGTTASTCRMYSSNVSNIKVRKMKITGNGSLQFWANAVKVGGFVVEDVEITSNVVSPYAFGTWTANKGEIDGLIYNRCKAVNCCHNGFILNGDKANRPEDVYPTDNCRMNGGWTKNVQFIDCQSINSGVPTYYGDGFATGFDLAEGTNVSNVLVKNCVATGNRASGFHMEKWPYTLGVVFEGCKSDNNGLPAGSSGYGYLCRKEAGWHETTLTNCTASGNKSGPCTCQNPL